MRAWLLGREGEGIKMISTMLNITRLHNSVTSVGVLGRGLAISKSYAAIRKLNSAQTLDVVPLFAHTISKLVVEYHSNMQLTFFVAYLLGMLEHGVGNADGDEKYSSKRLRPRSEGDVKLLLRILTPIMKARTAKSAILGLQECMESLGGVGYLENEEMQQINVARLFRDANGKAYPFMS